MTAWADLAAAPEPPLDRLALALAAEFREVDEAGTLAVLGDLGEELAHEVARAPETPEAQCAACARVLGRVHRFTGDTEEYDHPDNSMLDLVVERRRGLPILLSVVYIEVARRAEVPLRGVGLPGHFVVGHLGEDPPMLIDPFSGGAFVETDAPQELRRPWDAHETAMRMLNNLVSAYQRRGDLGRALRAAAMRLDLPVSSEARQELQGELRSMHARLN